MVKAVWMSLGPFPIENRQFRLRLSLFLGFIGQIPIWIIASVLAFVVVDLLHSRTDTAYVLFAPLAPGLRLADAIYEAGHGDLLLLLLAWVLNGLIYTAAIHAALTLWCRRRQRRTPAGAAPKEG